MFTFICVGYDGPQYIKDWYWGLKRQLVPWKAIVACDDYKTEKAIPEDPRITIVPFDGTRRYAAHNRWRCLQKITEETVVAQLDLDDYLKPKSLQIIKKYYDSGKKVTCGNFETLGGTQIYIPSYTNNDIHHNEFVFQSNFRAPPTRTFHSSLIEGIKEDDFKVDGQWIHHCTDVALMFSVFNQIKGKDFAFIPDRTYVYRENRENSTFGVNKKYVFDQLKAKYRGRVNV